MANLIVMTKFIHQFSLYYYQDEDKDFSKKETKKTATKGRKKQTNKGSKGIIETIEEDQEYVSYIFLYHRQFNATYTNTLEYSAAQEQNVIYQIFSNFHLNP